jgi:iron complex transport system substrate-binding protein
MLWAHPVMLPATASPEAAQQSLAQVEDSVGHAVPVRAYQRIASTSTVADGVLAELIESSRVVAIAEETVNFSRYPWRFEGKVTLLNLSDTEVLLSLRPDLVFVNGFADARAVERVRQAGTEVFDLGAMRGLGTLETNVRDVAAVLGVPERGAALWKRFRRRLGSIAAAVPEEHRHEAMYLGVHGVQMFGGGSGTSFHDVLEAAGLVDRAARAGIEGWPRMDAERVLMLDPPWIVTPEDGVESVCRVPGMADVEACRRGRVVGVDRHLLVDPGLGMLEAAEALHERVYGRSGSAASPSVRTP